MNCGCGIAAPRGDARPVRELGRRPSERRRPLRLRNCVSAGVCAQARAASISLRGRSSAGYLASKVFGARSAQRHATSRMSCRAIRRRRPCARRAGASSPRVRSFPMLRRGFFRRSRTPLHYRHRDEKEVFAIRRRSRGFPLGELLADFGHRQPLGRDRGRAIRKLAKLFLVLISLFAVHLRQRLWRPVPLTMK